MEVKAPDSVNNTSDIGENIGGQNRVFLIVLDSFGIGRQPDAEEFGDAGSNTLAAVAASPMLFAPNLAKLGLFNIDGVKEDILAVRKGNADFPAVREGKEVTAGKTLNTSGDAAKGLFEMPEDGYVPEGSFARLEEKSIGKDTTIGHWEIAGILSDKPLPLFPEGFPQDVIDAFEQATGRKTLCNRPYSGTDVIRDFGRQHVETGSLIVYTSADSVFQIASHEDVVPLQELYRFCEIAREILSGPNAVGRVIARPFNGTYPDFKRTAGRHDFSLAPPKETLLDLIAENRKDVIAIGKIHDIFAGRGITRFLRTTGNADGIEKIKVILQEPFEGLCFVNLVDFDMMYGHRNDADGYADAISAFDRALPDLMQLMAPQDILMITADHGCDPSTASTDHSRECVPLLIYGKGIKKGENLHIRHTFSDIAASIAQYLTVSTDSTDTTVSTEKTSNNTAQNAKRIAGTSFLSEILPGS